MTTAVNLSNRLEPSARAFLETVNSSGAPPIYQLPVSDARGVLSNAQSGPVEKMDARIEDHVIRGGPHGEISIRIVRPSGSTGELPVVMYFHGGGWVLGDKETHDRLIREISNGAWAAVVFVDFRRSPEAQYPAVLEEAYAAVKYIAENGKQFQLDATRIAIAGDSAGGNLAIAVTLLAKERKGPRIGYQVLFYPVTDANFDTSSYHEFANDHFLTREAMKWFWNQYAPEAADRKQITASPLRASIDQLVGLPPALVITGEFDVLRDEGEAYAGKLTAAGVRVTAVRCLGTIHDFVMLNAVTTSPQTRAAIAMASSHLQTFFGK